MIYTDHHNFGNNAESYHKPLQTVKLTNQLKKLFDFKVWRQYSVILQLYCSRLQYKRKTDRIFARNSNMQF